MTLETDERRSKSSLLNGILLPHMSWIGIQPRGRRHGEDENKFSASERYRIVSKRCLESTRPVQSSKAAKLDALAPPRTFGQGIFGMAGLGEGGREH